MSETPIEEIVGVEADDRRDRIEAGAETLAALCRDLRAAQDANEQRDRVAGVLFDDEDRSSLAHYVAAEPERADPRLTGLPHLASRGAKGAIEDLVGQVRTAAERLTEEWAEQEREADASQASRQIRTLADRLGAPEDLEIPPPYVVERGGVYRERERNGEIQHVRIAHAPLLPVARLHDIETDAEHIELAWTRGGAVRSEVVPRDVVSDRRALAGLSARGAPVHSGNAGDLVQATAAIEAANLPILPVRSVTSHLGWLGDGPAGFMLAPEGHLGDLEAVSLAADDGLDVYAAAWGTAGTWDGWLEEVARPALEHPRVCLMLYTAIASPLVRILGCRPWITHIHSGTSRGKSTAAAVAMSAWGSPDTVGTWATTLVAIERRLGLLHDLPLCLDDTRLVPRHLPELPADVAYLVEAGRGRARGTIRGVDRTPRWQSTCISTGEAPLTAATQQGGTRARVLEIHGPPLGPESAEAAKLARRLTRGAKEHHGHLGRRMIQHLLDRRDEWPKLRRRHAALTESYAEKAGGSAVAGRLCSYIAAMTVAAEVAEKVGLPAADCEPWGVALEAAHDGGQEADRATEALHDVLAWADQQPSRWVGRLRESAESRAEPPGGWLGRWDPDGPLCIYPHELRAQLERLEHRYAEVVGAWKDRGWLRTPAKGRQWKARIQGSQPLPVIAITAGAIEEAQGGDDD